MADEHISTLAITGGPCSGKTTALSFLAQKLSDLGFFVAVVPETATELIQGGIFRGEGGLSNIEFQRQVLLFSLEKENRYREAMSKVKAERKVLLCDRGALDGAAYIERADFEKLIISCGYTLPQLRDVRYDGVIHLVTAASGAEEYYTLSNNAARTETPEEARALDEKLIHAWNGCPHLKVISNYGDFEVKKHRTLEAVCRVLGIPAPLEIERKFLVRNVDFNRMQELGVHFQIISITQAYLSPLAGKSVSERIRERRQYGASVFYHTKKTYVSTGVRIETERQIDEWEYRHLLTFKDVMRRPIVKDRLTFVWKHQYFELDVFKSPKAGLQILEVELTREGEEVSLPPFIEIDAEVTADSTFSNQELALL